MSVPRSFLLPRWLARHLGRIEIYSCGRISIRPGGRGGPGRSRCTGPSQVLRTRVPVAVDHKPLLKLFGDRCLEDIPNPRLRNLKEKTLRYLFRMVYIPGTGNLTSDALSRHPSGTRTPTRLHLPDDLPAPNPNCPIHALADDDGLATAMCAAISTTPINWEQLQTATTADQSLHAGPNAGHRSRTTHQTQLAPSGDTGLLSRDNRPHHSRRRGMSGRPPRHPILPTASMPCHPAHCTPRDKRDDSQGESIHILARPVSRHRRHKEQLQHLQRECPLPTSHATHNPRGGGPPV